MTAHLCSRPSASPQEQRGNWLASPVQLGLVVRYLGLSATPPEFAERLLAELQKNSTNPGPLPQVPCAFKVCRFCRRAD